MPPPGPMRSMWLLRATLVVLGLALGVTLIATGTVVVGVIIGAIAVVRAAMLLEWWRRRRRYRGRFARRTPDAP